jgi:diaminopimelate decarboxylase
MAALGLDMEVSSVGELSAVEDAGVSADRTLYTGPGKSVGELDRASQAGVRLFSVESESDRCRLVRAAGDRQVGYLVRLHTTGVAGAAGLRMSGWPTQFGVDAATLQAGCAMLNTTDAAHPVGFHVFSATNVVDENALLAEFDANIATAALTAERTGFTPAVVNIGGGFAAPYATPGPRPAYPRLRSFLTQALDARLPGWRSGTPTVTVESGRHLVAEAGTLLTTVMDVKERGGRTYLVCDAGVNVLGGMSGIGRLLPQVAQPLGYPDAQTDAILVGPLCTPLDILSRSARVSEPAPGEVLAIPNVGAYGLTASLVAFLGRPLPVEVVLDGSGLVDARRVRLSVEPVRDAIVPGDRAWPAGS